MFQMIQKVLRISKILLALNIPEDKSLCTQIHIHDTKFTCVIRRMSLMIPVAQLKTHNMFELSLAVTELTLTRRSFTHFL